jgi:M6 family metalloprotease-like protein
MKAGKAMDGRTAGASRVPAGDVRQPDAEHAAHALDAREWSCPGLVAGPRLRAKRSLVPLSRWAAALAVCALFSVSAAGQLDSSSSSSGPYRSVTSARLGKPLSTGTCNALVVFTGAREDVIPGWAHDILDPDVEGSLARYYDVMSYGSLRVRGEVAPRRYASRYLIAADVEPAARVPYFCLDILRQVDADVDYARFDNDGPDGTPGSGDDDGLVDAVLIVVPSADGAYLPASAIGVAGLGFGASTVLPGATVDGETVLTDDHASDGAPIRIAARRGTLQQGDGFTEVVGAMAHEFGHLLGLRDLYGRSGTGGASDPSVIEESGGIGRWGLMGLGPRRRAEQPVCVESGPAGLGGCRQRTPG